MGGIVLETESEKLIRKGHLEGRLEGKNDVIIYMLSKGRNIDEIADLTGIDIDIIKNAQAALNKKNS